NPFPIPFPIPFPSPFPHPSLPSRVACMIVLPSHSWEGGAQAGQRAVHPPRAYHQPDPAPPVHRAAVRGVSGRRAPAECSCPPSIHTNDDPHLLHTIHLLFLIPLMPACPSHPTAT